ncbi:uncharacterized protein EV420DRAFT_635871 [Desarmillaria tabescens]|uniref:Uncharacterized protein n=1 Tax=Armillaria tabescens TaxID=1929756 RepID=A0AA39K265_ARMTA|nr:uncharacterized protein EV420DRAFT_635871 [Desarmillaria tabescens]KAK0453008.1 hypothetical protein EV420DRAFT_635871 [Desarmillaria tabescens]
MAHTYIPLMLDHHHGFPLWFPDSDLSLPLRCRDKGICVGDLGYITVRGAFAYLFNVYASADDPINKGRVPPIFEPLEVSGPSAREQELHPEHHTLTTPGIQQTASAGGALTSGVDGGVGLTFSCSSTQGAALVLPDGAVRYDVNQSAQAKLHKYAKKYAQYWYQYLNGEQGREMRNGSLYLVTGCDKSHSWEAVCFHPPTHSSVSSPFSIVGAAEVGGTISHEWMFQTGPSRRNHRKDTMDPNQAIFLRGYSISVPEKPMIQEQLLKDKTTGAVEIFSIDGSKTKGPLIVPLVPYGIDSRYSAPVEDMDMYGEGAEDDSEDDADSSDDDEDPERFSQEAEVIEDKGLQSIGQDK